MPVDLQPAFGSLGGSGSFPVAKTVVQEILSLPLYPGITVQQQERVVDVLRSALS